MNIVGIIPARMASSRFPGKPMAKIHGVPMIGHCYLRSKMSKILSEVIVATCDVEIQAYIESLGGIAIMTSDQHERASDRTAEAVEKYEAMIGKKVDIVVMIQGDEPMLVPQMLDEVIEPVLKNECKVANLMAPIKTREEHDDPNEVKVVVDKNNHALYFSREPIPSWKKGAKNVRMLKQVCLIPFTRQYLQEYNALEQTPLEIAESVDMLRVLENGEVVKMVYTEYETYSVDTIEDLNKVEHEMINDELMKKY